MLTIGFVAIVIALLVIVGVFALMAKDNRRGRQSGSPGTASDAKQGRATGPD
jgi:hypothetical protein